MLLSFEGSEPVSCIFYTFFGCFFYICPTGLKLFPRFFTVSKQDPERSRHSRNEYRSKRVVFI
jgi:hypothetical protein